MSKKNPKQVKCADCKLSYSARLRACPDCGYSRDQAPPSYPEETLYLDYVCAAARHLDMPANTLAIHVYPDLATHACQLFRHEHLSPRTIECLTAWLQTRHPGVDVFGLALEQVRAELAEACGIKAASGRKRGRKGATLNGADASEWANKWERAKPYMSIQAFCKDKGIQLKDLNRMLNTHRQRECRAMRRATKQQ